MKLYYSPGASSLATHIVLRHCGIDCELVKVNLRKAKLADGSDYLSIHPLGEVPLLQLDDAQTLSECGVILQYLGDQAKDTSLMPVAGSLARYQQMSWLNFIATEIHKNFSILFNPHMPEEAKVIARTNLSKRMDFLSIILEQHDYLMENTFTAADAYLFTTLRWSEHCGIALEQWPIMATYRERLAALPAIDTAMRVEGLIRQ